MTVKQKWSLGLRLGTLGFVSFIIVIVLMGHDEWLRQPWPWLGEEYLSAQPAKMMAKAETQLVGHPDSLLSEMEFHDLVTCVFQEGGTVDVLGSDIYPSKLWFRYATGDPSTIELQLVEIDTERVVGAFVYTTEGASKGWEERTQPQLEDMKITERDFVNAGFHVLSTKCPESVLRAHKSE